MKTKNEILKIAESFVREYKNGQIEPAHILKALMQKTFGLRKSLKELSYDVYYIEEWAEIRIDSYKKSLDVNDSITLSDKTKLVFQEAEEIMNKKGIPENESILVSLSIPGVGFSYDELKSFIIKPDDFVSKIKSFNESETLIDEGSSNDDIEYCINLNRLIERKEGHPIIGKSTEVQIIKETLIKWVKPNVLIVGDSGVGKSSVIELFINDINNGLVPESISDITVYELDISKLKNQVKYKGELEDRTNTVISKIKNNRNSVLFIDNIHNIYDKSSELYEVGSILKYEMSKGIISVIGISNIEGYTKNIESDSNLNDNFEKITIEEPNSENSQKILLSIQNKLEEHHGLKLNDEIIPRVIDLSKRYFTSSGLPQSAIVLLDQTFASVRTMLSPSKNELEKLKLEFDNLSDPDDDYKNFYSKVIEDLHPLLVLKAEENIDNKQEDWKEKCKNILKNAESTLNNKNYIVDDLELNYSVSKRTSIPLGNINKSERDRLINMDQELKKRVVGQDFAIKSIVEAVFESRAGLAKSNQPIGSFFFLGPTGTGKTELAKALSEFLFDDESSLIRFDMSEFKEEHSAALLYGAPPGYVGYEEGGMLVNKIRKKPYSVVLFDEIEKAHPSVYDIFLQILDEGVLHDRLGKKGDFTNAVILFTSNIGSDYIAKYTEKGELPSSTELMEVMSNYFRPEFLARLTAIVPFSPISEDVLVKIFSIHLQKLINRTKKLGISFKVEEPVIKKLALHGFTPKYGARPLIGVIRNKLRKPLSKLIVSNEVGKGSEVICKLSKKAEIKWEINN